MASAARDLRYRAPSVDGNLARQLDWEVRERELRHAGEIRREAAETPRPQVRERTRQAQHVSVLAVAGFLAAGALAVLVLLHYIQLTVVASNVVELRSELAELEKENDILTTKYEETFDLDTVRAAAEAMGMTKPSSSQIFYVDLAGGDSVQIHDDQDPGLLERVLAPLHHGVYAVVEYFD